VAATAAAALGLAALVTGAAPLAALSGVAALAVASLAVRSHPGRGREEELTGDPEPAATVAAAAGDGAPGGRRGAGGGEVIEEAVPVVPGALDELVLDALLRNRIAFARRTLQPLAVVHVDVGAEGDDAVQAAITETFASTLRESDVFGQRSDGIYVFVLADTGEDGAVWTAERLRRGFADVHDGHVFFAGIACYPSHALEADAVDAKAAIALDAAREWHQDRIEVALA
jgi:GGDEF domain-containing protein